ncbi:MAG: TetR/AcrR family transcriptional regulator [Acetobacteraceae bacterium]
MSVPTLARSETESPKRLAVLDAAADLFIAQGYGAVSMDALARAANVSKATLYAHFRSKDLLFATIIAQACRANVDWETVLPPDAQDIREALTRFGRQILRFLLEDRALAIHRVVLAECVRFPELGRAFFDGGPATARILIGAWLTEQAAAGRLDISDPELAAEQLMALLRAGLHLRATLGVPPSPDEAEIDATVAAAVGMFLAAYGAESGSKPSRCRSQAGA